MEIGTKQTVKTGTLQAREVDEGAIAMALLEILRDHLRGALRYDSYPCSDPVVLEIAGIDREEQNRLRAEYHKEKEERA